MTKLCIYRNPGEWICQNLNNLRNTTSHSSLNDLVNERFAGFADFLRSNYGDSFTQYRIDLIKSYLKNMSKNFDVIYIDFPGDLQSGAITETINPISTVTNYLFKLN